MTIREFIRENEKSGNFEKMIVVHHGEYTQRHSVKNGLAKISPEILNREITKIRYVCNNTVHLYIYPDIKRHELYKI